MASDHFGNILHRWLHWISSPTTSDQPCAHRRERLSSTTTTNNGFCCFFWPCSLSRRISHALI
ncbi:hypothetical protein U1Q18_041378, partial [Sarracenia purpurea var. burkii]